MEYRFYVGTYSSAAEPGIHQFHVDFERQTFCSELSCSGVDNPSYLLLHPNGRVLYTVEELTPDGRLTAFTIEKGQLVKQKTLPTHGSDPCHLALDESGRFLFVANYTSGSLAVFRLDEAGLPAEQTDFIQHHGKGIHPIRQQCPHVHFSAFHQGLLYVTDLGLDTVFCYRLNAETGTLSATTSAIHLPAGSGPRHLCFTTTHPEFIYILCELVSSVFVCRRRSDGSFECLQTLSALPEDYRGDNIAAAIKCTPEETHLVTSNRGHNSVAVFAIAPDGYLTRTQICPTDGSTPRDITFFGHDLLAANQDSDLLTALHWDGTTFTLLPMTQPVPHPVCILPAEGVCPCT